MAGKSSFVDKVLGRIGRLDAQGLQTVVQRLARERNFLETLFNTIEDGVLVVDEAGRILYFNQAVSRLLGLQPHVEGEPITNFIPELDWEKIARVDQAGTRGGFGPHDSGRNTPPSLPLRRGALGRSRNRLQAAVNGPDCAESARKLEQYLTVAKGEINRLDYIITQFLQAIRPTPLQLKLISLNEVVHKTVELLQP